MQQFLMPKCNLIEGNIENEQVLCDLIVVGIQVSHSNPTVNRLRLEHHLMVTGSDVILRVPEQQTKKC